MLTYRLARQQHLASPLDGEGARRWGGRWNRPGHRLVYLADHPATAILETVVHLTDPTLAPTDYFLLTVDVPDATVIVADRIDPDTLPPDWREEGSVACQRAGHAWLGGVPHAAVCWAPSAVIPGERNLLLDPEHAEAGAVRVITQQPFVFDPRLLPRK